VSVQALMVPSTCGACGAEMHTGVTLSFRDGPVEDDRQVLFYSLTIEILGGCEHADEVRDTRVLRTDPESV
jgi:hypothetical protein